jgi:hypothetical protein
MLLPASSFSVLPSPKNCTAANPPAIVPELVMVLSPPAQMP